MKPVEFDDLIPFYGCAQSIWAGIDDGRVGGLLTVMNVVVKDTTPDGIVFYRIHDNYSHLGLGHMFYKTGIHNGREVNIPTLYLSYDAIDAVTETFELLLAMADKNMVKALLERSSRKQQTMQASCGPEQIRQDVHKTSGCCGKTEHVGCKSCLHGCGCPDAKSGATAISLIPKFDRKQFIADVKNRKK